MDNFIKAVLVIFFGIVPWVSGAVVICLLALGETGFQVKLAVCESELPRNQHCKLIAVPEKEAQDD